MEIIRYSRQMIDDDDIESIRDVMMTDWLTQGPKISEFETIMAEYHNAKFAVAFSSGTAALHGAYCASGISEGDEFITSPMTFCASANAGVYCKAIPKFCDIDKTNYCIDLEKLPVIISEKTKVITPVSYAGFPVNIKKIKEIIGDREIVIIHDAAHAIGAICNNRTICEDADMTMLSFHPVKHVATGEGGMILTNSEYYYKKLMKFRTHGITKDENLLTKNDGDWYYEMQEIGYNYRITDIQAALGITQVKKLNRSIYERNKTALFYDNELKEINWLRTPAGFDKAWLSDGKYADLKIKPENLHSYHLYPILVNEEIDRKDFFDYMRKNGIIVQVHYVPVHLMPYYKKNYNYSEGMFPVAEDFYNKEVSIPMFYGLTEEQRNYVIGIIKKYKS